MNILEKYNRKEFLKKSTGHIIKTGIILSPSFLKGNHAIEFLKGKRILGPYITFKENPYSKKQTDTIISWASKDDNEEISLKNKPKNLEKRIEQIKVEDWMINHAILRELEPGKKYTYSIKHKEGVIKNQFTTKPNKNKPFKFTVYGDTQRFEWFGHRHKKIIEIMSLYNPDFVIHQGDRTQDGRILTKNLGFIDIISPLASKIPFYLANGNHNYNSSLSDDFFLLPGKQQAYQIQWTDCTFTFLDSSRLKDKPRNYEQLKLLKNLDDSTMNFLIMHHPLRGTSNWAKTQGLREIFNIGEKLKDVNISFGGHQHNYTKEKIIDVTGKTDYERVDFTVGTGGSHALNFTWPWQSAYSLKKSSVRFGFMLFEVEDKNNISFKFIGKDNDIIDQGYFKNKHLN